MEQQGRLTEEGECIFRGVWCWQLLYGRARMREGALEPGFGSSQTALEKRLVLFTLSAAASSDADMQRPCPAAHMHPTAFGHRHSRHAQ